ncbi:MAG: error-prone DNA polymerase [Rhodobacteraceae bacterium]|nr:error-prone DNA polymerase [Paracoccaceae bacterium]
MFAELDIISNFTFLKGASHPEEYARMAARLGMQAFAIADENSVAGIVRAYVELHEIARRIEQGEGDEFICVPRLLPAAGIITKEGFRAVALLHTRVAWGRLTRLLSKGRLDAPKGQCRIAFADLLDHSEGMDFLVRPQPELSPDWISMVRRLSEQNRSAVSLEMAPLYDGRDREWFDELRRRAAKLRLPPVASARPVMHVGNRRCLADVLTAIREGIRVDQLGRRAQANSERRLRSPTEMLRLFQSHEEAVERSAEIAERCRFSLDELRYQYPSECGDQETPQQRLQRLAEAGIRRRYPEGVPAGPRKLLERELHLIGKLRYAPYFLTVHDIVTFARSHGILCQGRGSAANSVVCYALGITSVSPEIGLMVFERFVSEVRDEPPDIDVDFEHERREEVIQHIYERFGRHHAGLCATVVHYRGKRAIREVGKAMGMPADTITVLASQVWGWGSGNAVEQRLREVGMDPSDPWLTKVISLCREIQGFPRHLSQHVGGFVISEGRLDELVPIENAAMEGRTVICWNKDDISALGILKVDILALGMLTCIRKAFALIKSYHGQSLTLESVPGEDPAVYDMLCRADSVGVFQVESRAQMNFLPRMKPRNFYDLVIEVAIIRPGPIQGDMVHPYLRRRNGEEAVSFPNGPLGAVLKRTFGVPLFQEQAMQIAVLGAGFSPSEADRLRRALATFRQSGTVHLFRDRFIEGMLANGHEENFAKRCFSQIEGFGEYGFPESHAASFAFLAYVSAWLKHHHPGVFACTLLNSQPMGFYAPAQIVRDAREHGVEILPVCINASGWENGLEPDGRGGLALRLGMRQLKSLSREDADRIVAARGNGYRGIHEVWRRSGIKLNVLKHLAEADMFAALGMNRRQALWEALAVKENTPSPLFDDMLPPATPTVELPAMTMGEQVVEDYVAMRLTLRAHPLALLRHILTPDTTHQCHREVPAITTN